MGLVGTGGRVGETTGDDVVGDELEQKSAQEEKVHVPFVPSTRFNFTASSWVLTVISVLIPESPRKSAESTAGNGKELISQVVWQSSWQSAAA